MGAESSVPRDGKSPEDAPASTSGEELTAAEDLQVMPHVKPLQKNGQISSMTSLNGHSEDNTLAEVGQPDAVSVAQKEEALENTGTTQDEDAPQVNGEELEKESPDANEISAAEEKSGEEKPDDANEVGFKKIFRFVGFKFTLKKDKSEEKDPVKLLTVKDKDGEQVSGTDEPTKEEAITAEEKSTAEEKEADTEASTVEAELTEDNTDKAETADAPADGVVTDVNEEAAKEEGAEKEGEANQTPETTLSPFRKLFSGGLFSNLRKKASVKKTKEEEDKESAKSEETVAEGEEKKETVEEEQEVKEEGPAVSEEEKSEPKGEEAPVTPEEEKPETAEEPEVAVETPAAAEDTTDETKQEEEKAEGSAEDEKPPVEVTSEADLLSSQEKVKPQGSPLKKLFTGAGLKKLSTKKQKNKKDAESKLTESGEQAADQLQTSTDSAEAPKAESGPSSPDESGEHVVAAEVSQIESSQEIDGEVASDGEKKKEGIIAWSSFKRLVTPKKLVKRSSDSEDEATGEKPAKSATLSSSESAALAEKSVEEEAKEENSTEEEPKTETTEKLVSSTEEPKKKMDTSVSWEALMCMGGTKRKARRTSDSDDEETKIEEEAAAAESAAEVEAEEKNEAAVVTSQNTESDEEVFPSPEPLPGQPERESTWDTLKRMVMSKNKAKAEEKPEETPNQVHSDGETPKDESSFSLRKLFPGRRKKKVEKQASSDLSTGEEDSDTPAVVPLSEYEEQAGAEQEAPAEPAAIHVTVSTEERSPSWIPAAVEDADNKHDQLSDIPEEAENAATPKSVDTDIAEDETEEQAVVSPKALGRMGRRLSTAEVSSVTPAPSAEATIVSQESKNESATKMLGSLEVQVSEIPPQTSVTVEDVPIDVASEKTEYEPPTKKAESATNSILQVHVREEAMAICTGLGTKEIPKVALEKPTVPHLESMAVIRDSLSSEMTVEEKPAGQEQISVTEKEVLMVQVLEVETTDLEPMVENSQSEVVDIQAATETCEPDVEKVGIITTSLEETVLLQTTTVTENSPKAVIIDAITPAPEPAICIQSAEISEPTVETKIVKMDVDQLVAATEENVPVKEEVQVVTEEISSTMCEATKITGTKDTEPTLSFVLPREEVALIKETVVMIAPHSVESDQMLTSEEEVMVSASVSETVCDQLIQVKEIEEEGLVVDAVNSSTEGAEVSAVVEQDTPVVEEIKQDVQQICEIEAQSVVIQDAVEKIPEDTSEPKNPTAALTPVQAIARTEEEIEIPNENPIIIETPVAVVCEKPEPKTAQPLHVAMEVTDTFTIEVTESLGVSVEEGEEQEEEKPVKELKQAVEVKASEETVVMEGVTQNETLEEQEEEQSKEELNSKEADVNQAAEEVEAETEETKPEQIKEPELEIRTPVQVVLQIAQVVEEPTLEEEAVVEFDSNGPVDDNARAGPESLTSANKLSTMSEEATGDVPEAAAGSQPEVSGKCAEVMAQVIEVIEEAVKEIEPVSTEITAAS